MPTASAPLRTRLSPSTPLLVAGGVVIGGLAAWLMIGAGFANYDLAYSLAWGADLVHGRVPDYGVTLAPTPHPLATLEGMLLSPLGGAGAEDAATVVAFACLGALGVVTYALGREWFGPAAGLIAAAIVLTRQPVLSFGVRGYLDLPYLVLVLSAVLVEARRPRAGPPVLVLLGLAGLLRPEAWLFAAAYVAWRARTREDWLRLGALAAAAPLLWALSDLLIAGDPLHSLTGTRDNADTLRRATGLDDVPGTVPRRLGEILREPVLLGAALGGSLSLWLRRDRAVLGALVGVASLVAFSLFAAAGLPILGRYLLLPATLLAIYCAAALTGWRDVEPGPRRRAWQAAAVLTALALVAFAPKQIDRIGSLRDSMQLQQRIVHDLRAIADTPAVRRPCGRLTVPTHRPIPLLALYADLRPNAIALPSTAPREATLLLPADRRVERNFVLDPNDPAARERSWTGYPAGRNRSWVVLRRC